jgi:hypothetical protein
MQYIAMRYVACCKCICILQGLARLEELVRKVVDLVDNRVESNLRVLANTLLVDLPSDRSFTYDDFIASQNKFQVGVGPHVVGSWLCVDLKQEGCAQSLCRVCGGHRGVLRQAWEQGNIRRVSCRVCFEVGAWAGQLEGDCN